MTSHEATYRHIGWRPALTPSLKHFYVQVGVEVLAGACLVLSPLGALALWVGGVALAFCFFKPMMGYLVFLALLPLRHMYLFGIGRVDFKPMDVALLMVAAGWLIQGLGRGTLKVRGSPFDLPVALFFGWVGTSLLWVPSFSNGLIQFAKILYGLLVFYLTVNLVRDQTTLRQAQRAWLLAGSVTAAFGLLEVILVSIPATRGLESAITHWGKPIRTSLDLVSQESPNRLGFFLNLCLMASLAQVSYARSKGQKVAITIAMIGMAFVLLSTFSRSSWLGFTVAAALLFWLAPRLRMTLVTLLLAVTICVLIAAGGYRYALMQRLATLVAPPEEVIPTRLGYISAAYQIFAQNPVTGVGVGNFITAAPHYGSGLVLYPHNVYLYILSEYGLVGFALFLLLGVWIVWQLLGRARASTHEEQRLLFYTFLAGLLIYAFQGLFTDFMLARETEMYAFLGLAAAATQIHKGSSEQRAASGE